MLNPNILFLFPKNIPILCPIKKGGLFSDQNAELFS